MAKSNRVQSTTIQFNVQGIQEIFGYQKKIKDAMKEIIAVRKQGLNSKVGEEYEKELNLIKQLENEVKRYGNNANQLQKILENVGAASAKQLQQAEKSLKNIRDGIKFDGKKMGVADAEKEVGLLNNTIQKVHKQFEAIQAEAHNATGFKVMGKSVQQLNEFVTNFERNAQYLTSQMQNGKQVFAEWGAKATEAKVRLGQLDGSLLAVNKSSNAETLRAYIKGWQEVAQYSGASSEQIKRANENISKADALMRELMQKRIDNAGKTNLAGREYYSPAQVREAVEYMKQLSTTEKLTTEEREKLNASIKRGDEYLKQLTLDQQRYSMQLQLGGKQMSNIKTLSDASLASQKKYWTDMVANTERGTAEYNQYLATLQAVTNEEQRRASTKLRAEGGALVGQVNTGQFKGSIRETEEAIKKIQEYKKELNADTANGAKNIQTTEQALAKLNERLAQTKTEVINGKNSFDGLRSAAVQGVDAVVAKLPRGSEELKKMRSDLEAFKKSLRNPDPSKLQQIETIFTAIDRKEKEVAASEIKWSKYQGSELKKRSLDELKNAYEVLKKEIASLSPTQKDYNEKAMQMTQIDKRIKQLNKTMGEHKTSLENAASRLKNYVMIYLGFNQAIQLIRKMTQNTIELSDQMTNVRKVTGLTNLEIERMTKDLQAIDTRTANQQLMEMAEQAGKLGIATRQGADGIVEFVKAGQEIVNTLGDIGGAEAITELLKVNDVVNKNATSIEVDLGKIGSAILNIGNNSKATYADITEFTKRLGATGSAIGLSMEEIMGLGGAFSSLGESMERSSTASQRVLLGIVTRTKEVSEALNISYAQMDQLIKSGDVMGAFIMALKALNEQGVGAMEGFFKAIGGRNNQQARAAIALLSQHIDTLQYEVSLAKEGFRDGTLVTQEFEKANNNLAGVMARVQNELYEMTTAVSSSNGVLLDAANALLNFVKWLRSSSGAATVFGGVIAYLVAQLGMMLVKIPPILALLKAFGAQIVLTTKGMRDLLIVLFQAPLGFLGIKSSADKATAAMNRLKAASMTNWITALAVAIGMLIGYLIQMKDKAKEAAKAMGEMKQKTEEEMYALERLIGSLRRVWNSQKERQKGIDEFNKKFGAYYGHILSETASLNDLAIAYKAVAKAILEKNAAELEAKAESHGMEVSREEREVASGRIKTIIDRFAQRLKVGTTLKPEEAESLQSELEQTLLNYWGDESIQNKSVENSLRFLENKFKDDSRLQVIHKGNKENKRYNILQDKAGNSEMNLLRALEDYSKAVVKGVETQQRDIREANNLRGMAAEKARQQADKIYNQLTNPDRELTPQERYDLGNEYIRLQGEYGKKQPAIGQQMQQNKQTTGFDWLPKRDASNAWMFPAFQTPGVLDSTGKPLQDSWQTTSSGQDRTDEVKEIVSEVAKIVQPWGKTSVNWSEQYGGDLAAVIKFFDEFEKNAKQGQVFSQTSAYHVPTGVTVPQDIDSWSKDKIVQWAHSNWEEARRIQKQLNMDNDNGNFIEPKDKNGGKKPWEIAKDEFEAAIAALDQYYKDRETLIEISLNNEEITESEANRRKESLEAEHLMKRSQLRRDAIGKMDDAEMKAFEDWWDSVKELDKVNFAKYREQSVNWGKAYVQKLGLASSKDLSEIEKMLQTHKQKIDKILQDGDSVKKVTDSFKEAMDDLDLVFALQESEAERTASLANRRLTQLMEWSKKAYSINVEDLKTAMRETDNVYHAWFEALGEDQDRTLQAMLVRLRQYHDEMDETVRKAAKERKRIFDMVYNNSVGESGMTRQQENTAQTDRAKTAIAGQQLAEAWGYGGDNLTGHAELNLINLQIEQKLKYVEALKKQLEYEVALNKEAEKEIEREIERAQANPALTSDEYSPEEKAQAEADLAELQNQLAQKRQDTANLELETNVLLADSEKELTELRAEQVDKQIEEYNRLFDYLKEMQGNFESFAETFGEGIFGSAEDRKNAALDLVADVLKTTKRVTQAYLTEVATKKIADQTIVAMEQQKNIQLQAQRAASLANYGSTKVAELTVEGATAEAENVTAITKGTQKEVAMHGLKGLAAAAAIGVGLSLLLGLALGALNKAKSQTAAATGASGAGKLATGMLTYAQGRYPTYADGAFATDSNGRTQGQLMSVRGNDGNTYMAKYQPNLKTGVVNSPHLGIVGEKGAEVIIDHQTYEGLKRYDPETLQRIYAMKAYGMRSIDFSRTARMGNEVLLNRSGVRTYADGYGMDKLGASDGLSDMENPTIAQMSQTLTELTAVLATIKSDGIDAHMEYFGKGGAHETSKKGNKFLKRVGLGTAVLLMSLFFASCSASKPSLVEIVKTDTVHIYHTDTLHSVHNDTIRETVVRTLRDSVIKTITIKEVVNEQGDVIHSEKETTTDSFHDAETQSQIIQHTVDSLLQVKMDSLYHFIDVNKMAVIEKTEPWYKRIWQRITDNFTAIGFAAVLLFILWLIFKLKPK